MWGRIYPHAVFLIFANIMLEASCKTGSLTFLIDDTSSMGDDIKNVRRSVYRIKDIVLNETSSLIDNMVLVTLNDPGVYAKIVTKDPNEFKEALDAVKEHNELKQPHLDCWEPAMKGLLLALDKSKNDSYIFVFTDAPAKDYIDSQSVIDMCQKKQTQIVFVLTGTLCGKFKYTPAAIDSYFDIATACSGLAFFVQKNEVDKVFGPIEEMIKGNKNVITAATVPAGVSKDVTFTIDGYTDYAIIYASGKNVSLKIKERSISLNTIMSTDNAKVIKLNNAKPGSYVATVKGATRTSIIIVGRTDFYFSHGFSESKPKSLNDTSPQPISDDAKVYLSISVSDEHHSVKIESAQLLDMDGKPILTNLILSKISEDFYVTDSFVAPSQRFKVAVNGIDKATGKPIGRTAKIPVTPPPPKIAPQVQGVTVLKVKKGETALFECKVVRGFPTPKITWLFGDKSGSKFTTIDSDSVLLIKNVKDKDDGKYKCVAENVKGKDEHVITLLILDQPKIISSNSTVYKSSEGDASLRIPCSATGSPKPSITWKLSGRVIHPSAKYSIEDGTLIIRDPKMSDTNSYICEAKNEVNVVRATFKTYIGQAPQLSGLTTKNVRIGTAASIECAVVKGTPKPTITWQFMVKSSSNFLKIDGSDKDLHISRVENKDAGSYKCLAQNIVGSDEHITTLEVQDLPKIVTNVSTTYQSTEGDALLRIPCVATGLPKPNITWKLNGRVINSSRKYSIEEGTLIIRDPTVGDTTSYKCEAQNEVGTVSATFRAYVRQSPQVSGVAVKQARLGSSASMECTINKGEPTPKVTWQFMDNSSSKFSPIPGSDKVLHISRVESKHAGRYKCVAQNSVGSDEHIITLEVQDLPKIVTNVSTTYQSTEGDAFLRIPCVATGLPKPNITWKLNGRVINSSGKYSIEVGTLIIRDPTVGDTTSYTCEAQNVVGTVSATFRAYVRQSPQVSGVAVKQARLGSSASIECTINKGEPTPKVTWQFMDNSSSKFSPIPGADKVLHISRVESKHAGRYKCVAQNSVGSDDHNTTLEVQDQPKIVTSFSTTYQSTEEDSLLRIPCATTGLPKPTITWKLNGRVINSSVKYSIEDGSLIIKYPTVGDTNSYTCEAHNEVGTVNATFRAYIHQRPQVSGLAAKQVRLGSSASIECTINKGKPTPKVTWQFMDNSSSKFSPIPGTDQVLHISRVESTHAGRYKCVALNSVGSDEHITTLEVQDLPKIVTSVSTTYQSTQGDPLLRIPCVATGLPKPTITWKLNGRVINSSVKFSIEDGALIIRDPTLADTTSYTCEAQNKVGTVSATFRAYVRQLPEIDSSVSTIYESTEGDALLRIPCIAAGLPKPSITWKLDGHVINSSAKYSMEDGTLIIRDPNVSDTNSYTCEAKNEVGTVTATFKTYIRQSPKLSGVATKSVRMGSPVNIECKIDQGEPTPKISWQFMDKAASKFVPYTGITTTLRITNAENKHAGRYKCVAQNNVGSDNHITTLIVESLPGITINSTKVEGIQGDLALKIPCNGVGVPQPDITWKKNGTTITPNAKYSIEDGALVIVKPAVTDSLLYTCEAKNYIGSINATFQVTVTNRPKSFVIEHYVYLRQGETRKLECEAYSSESQSVKWFETKLLDSSLSTNSSPLELDSLETTIASISNMDSSTTPPTIETGNKEPYVQIVNALSSKHDGNYTCHVSDKHGNTQTHTYVVDVGIVPEFVTDYTSISDWRGDISDITQFCDSHENAKPTPVVQWTFNGKVLTDHNSAGVGQYTCNVSNVHGYVLKTFDVKSSACLINRNIKDAPYMPLVLNDEGSWLEFETTKYYTIVEQEVKITLSCASPKEMSNTFKNLPKKSKLEVFCDKEDSFKLGDKIYKLSDLQCTNRIQPSVIKNKVKCSTNTSELISVGYNVPDFLEAYEVCFDHKINMPVYTRIIMTATNNNGPSAGYNWYTYPGIGYEKNERRFTCKDASSSCCYSKSQLVNAIDFNDGPAKKSTFIDPLNVIPAWRPCNVLVDNSATSWEDVNDMVRTQLPTYTDIAVWSGTHTLQEKNGAVVPRYLWKVVRLDEDDVMAIVHVNVPKPTEKDIKCKTPDICGEKYDWFVRDESTYCCLLPDFLESFYFYDTDIKETLDAALDKMKEIPDAISFYD